MKVESFAWLLYGKDALSTSALHKLVDVAAIGVGSPGVNDLSNGIIQSLKLSRWNDLLLLALSELDDVPVYLENDANALLAEVWIGWKGCSDVVMMTLEPALERRHVWGRMIHGATGMAGEIGHAIEMNGRLNKEMGVRGIFEAYASATAVVQHALELQEAIAFTEDIRGKITYKKCLTSQNDETED